MLVSDLKKGKLYSPDMEMIFFEGPYRYGLSGVKEGRLFSESELSVYKLEEKEGGEIVVTGLFEPVSIEICHTVWTRRDGIEESITLKNCSQHSIKINKVEFGFSSCLQNRMDWNLTAIPFKVQLDGNMHEYSGDTLLNGTFRHFINGSKPGEMEKVYGNSVYSDATRPEPELAEAGVVRSEAWAWGKDGMGLVVIKYNNEDIELSVAAPIKDTDNSYLRLGGAGLCLYSEPSGVQVMGPGSKYTFGTTIYRTFTGGIENAFYIYRDYLESMEHTFPQDYNPPVNWNELYDVGWYHSDKQQLKEHYTREALLREAAKAKECSCDLLYLDPGWELAEGVTLWDEQRLGPVKEFVSILRDKFGIGLGYRTILRCYMNYWPHKFLVKRDIDEEPIPCTANESQFLWQVCMNNPGFWKEKLKRIVDISSHGIQFIMFDEMDWRGPCYDDTHSHRIPTMPIDHVMAVYELVNEVRKQCTGLLAEVHDPVWPWAYSIYVPTYFKQGADGIGYYDENWGFEFMWDCLNDLKSGKALSLYYYNLGCSIPLYLHVSMAADNDNCIFFWWAASTIRHLGIGGKDSNPTIEPVGKLPQYDKEKRFEAYKKSMRRYKALKHYFMCGKFTGIAENIHLHTLPGVKGAVLNVFNITDMRTEISFFVDNSILGDMDHNIYGVDESEWTMKGIKATVVLEPMSHALVTIGEAAEAEAEKIAFCS